MDYGLDVVRLREHVKCRDRGEAIAAGNQFLQIAGECRRVARDVGDPERLQAQNTGNDARLGAHARRIKQDEIDLTLKCAGRLFRQP